jgi:excisionase family DNA binding protein
LYERTHRKEIVMSQIENYPPILTIDQAAELLQYERHKVYELINKKVIPTFPPGARWGRRISRDVLMKIVSGQLEEKKG